MLKKVVSSKAVSRRIWMSSREIAAAVLLTLAAAGFLAAAILGQRSSTHGEKSSLETSTVKLR